MQNINDTHKYHTVRAGDTLSGIAQQYGISVEMLYRYNPHLPKDPRLLPIDTKIDINDALIDKRLQVSTGMITTFKRFFEPDKLYVEHGIKKKIAGIIKTVKVEVQTLDSGRKVVRVNNKVVNDYLPAPMVQVNPTELFNGGRYPGGEGYEFAHWGENSTPTRTRPNHCR